jgi:hypothetical protein
VRPGRREVAALTAELAAVVQARPARVDRPPSFRPARPALTGARERRREKRSWRAKCVTSVARAIGGRLSIKGMLVVEPDGSDRALAGTDWNVTLAASPRSRSRRLPLVPSAPLVCIRSCLCTTWWSGGLRGAGQWVPGRSA